MSKIPSHIIDRSREIKDFVAHAQLEPAIKRLLDFIRDFNAIMEDEVIILSMDLASLKKEERMHVVEREVLNVSKRKIALRILETLKATKAA